MKNYLKSTTHRQCVYNEDSFRSFLMICLSILTPVIIGSVNGSVFTIDKTPRKPPCTLSYEYYD